VDDSLLDYLGYAGELKYKKYNFLAFLKKIKKAEISRDRDFWI
jgi:hypothetical protein